MNNKEVILTIPLGYMKLKSQFYGLIKKTPKMQERIALDWVK